MFLKHFPVLAEGQLGSLLNVSKQQLKKQHDISVPMLTSVCHLVRIDQCIVWSIHNLTISRSDC